MDGFMNVIEEEPEVRIKINNMLDIYDRILIINIQKEVMTL